MEQGNEKDVGGEDGACQLTDEQYETIGRFFGSFAAKAMTEIYRPKTERSDGESDEDGPFRRGGVTSFGRKKKGIREGGGRKR